MLNSLGLLTAVLFAILSSSCGGGDEPGGAGSTLPWPSSDRLRLEEISTSLNAPVFMTWPPDDTARLFVVERQGLIRILDATTGTPRPNPFLDIRGLVSTDGERGFLGLAFDPDYATSRRLFVFYTDLAGNLVIARYLTQATNNDLADQTSPAMLLSIPHPTFSNHNGGMLAFGPDGCLYVGTGDGGGRGDPNNNAQNPNVLLGKVLRLDPVTGNACSNVVDNPYVLGGGAPEVWSVGLRNPWRFSFDRQTGDLYIADVGEDRREEVNVVGGDAPGRGANFGWRLMEGSLCFTPATDCNPGSLILPVFEYAHETGGCSITGGYVYRGALNAPLAGAYFYGDFCAGFVNSFRLTNGQASESLTWPLLRPPGDRLSSFGEDARGELYVMTLGGGLFRIVPN
jgi:glucose/arabinose dehydrogenase